MIWLVGMVGLLALGSVVSLGVPENEIEVDIDQPETLSNSDNPVSQINDFSQTDDWTIGEQVVSPPEAQQDQGDVNDIVVYEDTIVGGPNGDVDLVETSSGENTATQQGSSENDLILGTDGDDIIHGAAGNDTLQGVAGTDVLIGNEGNDVLQGGLDDDHLSGGYGEDSLFGGWGQDTLSGIDDDAPHTSASSGDFLSGDGGNDLIFASQNDIVLGGEGQDRIVLGDWLGNGQQTQILDFSNSDDSLLFIWDDAEEGSEEPEVSLRYDPIREGQMQVWLGTEMVAQIAGPEAIAGLEITLIPYTVAAMTGLIDE